MATRRPLPETTLAPSAALEIETTDRDCDRRDVEAALSGDGDAYGRLVGRYQQPIAAYMWRFTRDHLRWEELIQEVFVEAYFSLGTYRAEAPLLHWLRRIATRVGYRQWKEAQRRRRQTALSPELFEQLAQADPQQADVEEAAALVHALLAELSPRDRLVLTLLHLEECSVEETARLTGWSRSMVKVQAYRARKRLQRLMVSKESRS
jgi:RNA polymerase sigma-70 factor (ECF subfamily)